jgi:hypothetical protein
MQSWVPSEMIMIQVGTRMHDPGIVYIELSLNTPISE